MKFRMSKILYFSFAIKHCFIFPFCEHMKIIETQSPRRNFQNEVKLLNALPRRNQNHISTHNERRQMVWNFK